MRRVPLRMPRESDGWWIVSDERTLAYGEGRTRLGALWDYLISLRDLWELRREDRRRDRGGPRQ